MRKPATAMRLTLAGALAWALWLTGAQAASVSPPEIISPPPVAPFILAGAPESQARAVTCLASAVYYESADQPLPGRQAVAQVVLNRVRHPNYPKTVCGVVYQGASRPGCQFTFACDGSTRRSPDTLGWADAQAVAREALSGFVAAAVGASTHYHAIYVHPLWSDTLVPAALIGAHRFYHFPGLRGAPEALVGAYDAQEPSPMIVAASPPAAPRMRFGLSRAPRPATFSVWGLQVGVIEPDHGGGLTIRSANPS